eukprot:354893-Chlamydomonas_euryale.AAC.1
MHAACSLPTQHACCGAQGMAWPPAQQSTSAAVQLAASSAAPWASAVAAAQQAAASYGSVYGKAAPTPAASAQPSAAAGAAPAAASVLHYAPAAPAGTALGSSMPGMHSWVGTVTQLIPPNYGIVDGTAFYVHAVCADPSAPPAVGDRVVVEALPASDGGRYSWRCMSVKPVNEPAA